MNTAVAVAACGLLAMGDARLSWASADSISFSNERLSFSSEPVAFSVSRFAFPVTPDMRETSATLEVTLAADVLFDFDKSQIRSAAEPALMELAEIIRSKARGPVTIQGYTDALGADAYNQRLSEQRAASVRTWLTSRERLPAGKLATFGFGARNPVAPNRHPDGSDDPEGRQRNRRVTVVIQK